MNGKNKKIRKTYCSMDFIYFFFRSKRVYILKPGREKGQSFEELLRGGNITYNIT